MCHYWHLPLWILYSIRHRTLQINHVTARLCHVSLESSRNSSQTCQMPLLSYVIKDNIHSLRYNIHHQRHAIYHQRHSVIKDFIRHLRHGIWRLRSDTSSKTCYSSSQTCHTSPMSQEILHAVRYHIDVIATDVSSSLTCHLSLLICHTSSATCEISYMLYTYHHIHITVKSYDGFDLRHHWYSSIKHNYSYDIWHMSI